MSERYDVREPAVSAAMIGRPVPRYEARSKVTGDARYAADEPLAGTLHAALATSPIAKGRIRAIDATAAEAIPGIRLVLTHENLLDLEPIVPLAAGGVGQSSFRQLSGPEVRFAGQMVALVVAETPENARLGVERLRIDYDEDDSAIASIFADAAPKASAVPARAYEPIEVGDIDAAFAGADATVEAEYRLPNQHHNPIELYSTSAVWRDGTLTAYVPSQWVAGTRAALATAFGMPTEQVRVISRYVGGGFGSKGTTLEHSVLVAAAARMLDAPVKLYVERREMFTVGSMRPQSIHRLRLAAKGGRLTAIEHAQESQTSRFDTFFLPGTEQTSRLYDWAAIRTAERTIAVDVNTPGFMRAPAETPALFALESAVDELAWQLKLDPVALRLASDAPVREPVQGKPWTSRSLAECLRRGAESFDWRAPKATRELASGDWTFGHGVATAIYPAYTRPATAELRFASDLSVRVSAAAHELGGGTYTICQQIAANELGVPLDKVRVDLGSSDLPINGVAGGSTQTASVGSAVLDACRRARSELIGRAIAAGGPLEGADATTIAFEDGAMRTADGRTLPLEQAFEGIPFGILEVRGSWVPVGSGGPGSVREFYRSGAAKQVGFVTDDFARAAFGAQFAEVAVNLATGEVRVPRLVGAFAAGRIMNERTARSQLMGGMIWGVGAVLHEATELDPRHARFVNTDLGEYLIPVNADVPSVTVELVEELDENISPIGAKGIGELGITGVNAAIANAVYHATGKRLREVPIRMEHLMDV